ncbi:MAG: hypothetical protein J5663_06315 [Bacteroidaceae bacterium]|nr:hypothetical protein [Bacteroidaceae bacterium]
MKLEIKKINTIKDLGTWFKYAEPEGGESQWKEGRSAMEFARYMISSNNNLPKEISTYLKNIGFKNEDYICYPEEITSFENSEFGKGPGRHHDGLLVSKNYLVGIEAKVSEPFDCPISKKMGNAKNNSDKGDNMHKRISNFLKFLKPDFGDDTLESVNSLMYQLVSGSVGTIIESRNRNLSNAVFLIIEFDGDVKKEKNYSKNVENNQNAYNDFLEFLKLKDKDDINRYIDVDVDKGKIRMWINKIRITIRKEEY